MAQHELFFLPTVPEFHPSTAPTTIPDLIRGRAVLLLGAYQRLCLFTGVSAPPSMCSSFLFPVPCPVFLPSAQASLTLHGPLNIPSCQSRSFSLPLLTSFS